MENYLEAGKITNTHGLRGEVKVVTWTDYPEVFEDIEYLFANTNSGEMRLDIERIKYQKSNIIVKFKQLSSIEEAEKLKGRVLYVEREMLGELPENVHYIADLIGLEVFEENGNRVGVIADVFNTGASDIYDVKREGRKNLLLPVIDEVVKEIDVDSGRVVVNIMEGLDD